MKTYSPKAALFDMDGTLIDSEPVSAYAWKRAGREIGFNVPDSFIESIRGFNKIYQKKFAAESFGDSFDYETLHELHSFFFHEYASEHGIDVKKGAIELLKYLKDLCIPMAIATSTRKVSAEKLLVKTGLYGFFDFFVYGDDVKKSKPDPEIFIKAAEGLDVNISDCIIFEDSPNGLKAARNSGATVFAVPDMIPITGEYAEFADEIFPSLDSAIGAIKY